MGSPLGPLFANIFMDEFEQKHMNKLKELGVINWMRYVDDIFATITNQQQHTSILNYLNSQHNNIKFTIEMERNNKIPFLDTCITKKNNRLSTSIYHKPTFTGIYLNWTSLTSRKYKISLIYCLCDRIWKICQNPEERDQEFRKLKHTLAKNEYPETIINKEIDKFIRNKTPREEQPPTTNDLDNTIIESDENSNNQEQPSLPNIELEPEKQTRYITLPYCNTKVDDFAKRLTTLVNTNFDKVELKVAFKAPKTIANMFPFKDNIRERHLQSLVVYKIKCESCNQMYIGKTARILHHRIKEHNNPKTNSAIQMHKKDHPTHLIDASNIEILDKADNNFKLMLKEMLHIIKHKPELNTQHASQNKNKKTFKSQLNTIIIGRQV